MNPQATKNQQRLLYLLMFLALLSLAACGGEPEPAAVPSGFAPSAPAIALPGTDWDLVSYGSADALQFPLEGTRPTLSFTPEGLGGSTGCNSYFGGYTLDGASFVVGMLGSTQMFCEGIMEQELAIIEMLQTAEFITGDAEQLVIVTAQGEMRFRPPTHLTLEGVEWVLAGIASGEAVVSSWIDAEVTAVFADGQMTGSAGCNNYFASYKVAGDALTLGPVGATKMMCEEERGARELEFLVALQNVAGFSIMRESLTLTDAAGNGLLFFQPMPEM